MFQIKSNVRFSQKIRMIRFAKTCPAQAESPLMSIANDLSTNDVTGWLQKKFFL